MTNGQQSQPPGNGQQTLIPPGNGNGTAGLHQFRLDNLEKRVDGLETDAKKLLVDTTEIKAKMPTQANVYWLFAGALIVNFITLVGHLVIRYLANTPPP